MFNNKFNNKGLKLLGIANLVIAIQYGFLTAALALPAIGGGGGAPVVAKVPQGISFSGQLFDAATPPNPVSGDKEVIFQIYNPGLDCLLYEEVKTLTLSPEGNFASLLGSELASVARSANDPQIKMADIFKNNGLIRAAGTNCTGGYTALPGDVRKLRVTIDSEAMTPEYVLSSVPSALVAETLSDGATSKSFININSSTAKVTQTNVETIFSEPNYTALQNLIAGTSSLYSKINSGGGASLPVYASQPSTPAAGNIWYDSSSENIKVYTGTTTLTLGAGGGGAVSSVAGKTGAVGLVSADISDLASVMSTQISSQVSSQISSAVPSQINSVKGAANGIASLDGAGKIPIGQIPPFNIASIQSSQSAVPFLDTTAACTAGRALVYNSVTDRMACADIATQWTSAGSDISYTAGNVAIGKATASVPLDVQKQFGSVGIGPTIDGIHSRVESIYTSATYEQPYINAIMGEALLSNSGYYNGTASFVGLSGNFRKTGTGIVYGSGYGVYASASNQNATGSMGYLYGTYSIAQNNTSGGQVTNLYGVYSKISSPLTSTLGNAYGVYIDFNAAGATVTNAYGLYIKDLDAGTNQYSLYQAGTNDINYFAGNVGIGVSNPTAKLEINGDLRVNGAIKNTGSWSSQVSSFSMTTGYSYIASGSGSRVIATLPSACNIGEQIKIVGLGTAGWQIHTYSGTDKILQRDGSQIDFFDSLSSSDMAELTCVSSGPLRWAITNASSPDLFGCQPGSKIFDTNGDYIFEVPNGCAKVHVKVWGGGGGGGNGGAPGAYGGYIGGLITVAPLDKIKVKVGSFGGSGTVGNGGMGGGFSAIQRFDNIPIAVAGGGGAGGGSSSSGSVGIDSSTFCTGYCGNLSGNGGGTSTPGTGATEWSNGTFLTLDGGISAASAPSLPRNDSDMQRTGHGQGGTSSNAGTGGIVVFEWGK